MQMRVIPSKIQEMDNKCTSNRYLKRQWKRGKITKEEFKFMLLTADDALVVILKEIASAVKDGWNLEGVTFTEEEFSEFPEIPSVWEFLDFYAKKLVVQRNMKIMQTIGWVELMQEEIDKTAIH